jgi:hypothetical protein
LARLGVSAAPALDDVLRVLEEDDASIRTHAVRTIGSMGRGARRAARPLAALLDSRKNRARNEVIRALAQVGAAPADRETVLSALVRARIPNPVQCDVELSKAWLACGGDLDAAIDGLFLTTKSRDRWNNREAALLLGIVAKTHARARMKLEMYAADENGIVNKHPKEVLRKLNSKTNQK